jgi:hypothetical protein
MKTSPGAILLSIGIAFSFIAQAASRQAETHPGATKKLTAEQALNLRTVADLHFSPDG